MYEIALTASAMSLIVVILLFVRDRSFSIFHPLTMYIAFHGLIFVVRPIVAYFSDFNFIYLSYEFTPSLEDKTTVIFASNLGFLCFSLFSMYYGRIEMKFKLDVSATVERQKLAQIFPWVMAICVPIGVYSLIKTFDTASAGISDMIIDKGTGSFVNDGGSGYLSEAQLMLATCFAVFAWLFRFKIWALIPLLLFAVTRAGTGGRWPFVVGLSAVGQLYLYERSLKFAGIRLTVVLGILAFVFSAVGADRGQSIRRLVGTDNTLTINRNSDLKFMEGMDLGNLEYFEYLVYAIPQRTNTYGYFLDTFQVFTEPVPRSLWKNKPIGAPFNKISLFKYGRPMGLTRSLPGQGWYSLGWLGVVIYCSLWGLFLGWIYRKFVEGSQGALQTSAYMIFLTSLIATFRDGTLVTLLRYDLFFLLPIAIWLVVAKLRGIPSLTVLRKARQGNGRSADLTAPSLETLPPAVQRRRAALAGGGVPKA